MTGRYRPGREGFYACAEAQAGSALYGGVFATTIPGRWISATTGGILVSMYRARSDGVAQRLLSIGDGSLSASEQTGR